MTFSSLQIIKKEIELGFAVKDEFQMIVLGIEGFTDMIMVEQQVRPIASGFVVKVKGVLHQ